jgi:hypothetical protein
MLKENQENFINNEKIKNFLEENNDIDNIY